jgi:hypothetical protein
MEIRGSAKLRYKKFIAKMQSGKPVTPAEFESHFKGTELEPLMYRLSTYIYDAKLNGAIIRANKKGRKVESYQLVNYKEFDTNGNKVEHKAVAQELVEVE